MANICRLCAGAKRNLFGIETHEVRQKLYTCCILHIQGKDLLPQSVCSECLNTLNTCYQFHKKVQEAQKTLRGKIFEKTTVTNDYVMLRKSIPQDPLNTNYIPPIPIKVVAQNNIITQQDHMNKMKPNMASNKGSEGESIIPEIKTELNNNLKLAMNSKNELEGSIRIRSDMLKKQHTVGRPIQSQIKGSTSVKGTANKAIQKVQPKSTKEMTKSPLVTAILNNTINENKNCKMKTIPPAKGQIQLKTTTPSKGQIQLKTIPPAKGQIQRPIMNSAQNKATNGLTNCRLTVNEQTKRPMSNSTLNKDVNQKKVCRLDDTKEQNKNKMVVEVDTKSQARKPENPLVDKPEPRLSSMKSELGAKAEEKETAATSPDKQIQRLTSWKDYTYFCHICNFKALRLKDLVAHAHRIHTVRDANEMKFSCSDCKKIFFSYNVFLAHVRWTHHPALTLKCDLCDRLLATYRRYVTHRQDCPRRNSYPSYISTFMPIDAKRKCITENVTKDKTIAEKETRVTK